MFNSVAIIWTAYLCIVLANPIKLSESPTSLTHTVGYRLPNTISPTNYKIKLTPYLLPTDPENKRFTFDGEVHIEIIPNENIKIITLHSENLVYSLKEYWPKSDSTRKQSFQSDFLNTTTNIWDIELNEELKANNEYILHFIYSGTLTDDMLGFYRSSYVNDRNETKWLAATQFQSNHARRAFPSFDEPTFKATFDVTLVRSKILKTVSNTRLLSTLANGDSYIDVYQTTPKMSSYLLAFIVSEFNERNSDGDFGVIARPEFYDQTEYCHDVGPKLLSAFGDYFALQYKDLGNDKMHMAAIPDFIAGAMENWGLLTYRERNVLHEKRFSTLHSKQYATSVLAHELSHMWFGNYVSIFWWSNLWLNEAFARYFQYYGTHMVDQYFELDKQFVVDQVQMVMQLDSINKTNPLSDESTYTLTEPDRAFNSISYAKGACFVRMIVHTIGENNFQKSLQEYLKKFAFSNTKPQNLLDYWKNNWPAATKPHADAIFKSFTEQVGYPVITVNLSSDGKSVAFSQKRFLLNKNDGSDAKLVYTIPITYTTSFDPNFENTTPKFVLPNTGTHNETLPSSATWIIANIQESGYYRVNYNVQNWQAIHEALLATNWSHIHEFNRAQIVNDLFNLAFANEIGYDLALNVLEYLETELNYLPWTAAFSGFNELITRFGNNLPHFDKYIQKLTAKAYNQLRFEEGPNDSALNIYLREKILTVNCRYGNSDCISKAKKYFNTLSSKPVPKNIRSFIYCNGLREGESKEFDLLYNKFKTETIATEKTLLQNSFGCVKKKELVERVFNLVLSDEIRRQDKSHVFSKLYTENNENVSLVFKLIIENFEQVVEAFDNYFAIATEISNLAQYFTTKEQENDLINFNEKHIDKFGDYAFALKNAVTTVKNNLKWVEDNLGTFTTYLASRIPSNTL